MISIITAIYKSERYLAGYLREARKFADFLMQKSFSFEIIIVPTNPSQKEQDLLQTVVNESWCVIHPFSRLGIFGAWNEGFGLAKGEVLGPWNVDDIRFPEAVIEAHTFAQAGAEIIYFPFLLKRFLNLGPLALPVLTRKVEGEVLEFEKRKFQINMICGPHFMFTKKAFEKVGPFDEQFKIAGDFDWCARAAAKGLKFVCGKNYSGIFRVDGYGISTGRNRRLQAENNIIFTRQKAFEKVKSGLEDLVKDYQVNKILYHGNLLNFPDLL
jgi:GT2 family glycosyltransferase